MLRQDVTATTAERKAIESAWNWIEALCEERTIDGGTLALALKHETTGSDRIPRLQAKALLVNWFAEGVRMERERWEISRLYGLRPAALNMTFLGAHYEAKFTPDIKARFKASRDAYQAAFDRYLEATK